MKFIVPAGALALALSIAACGSTQNGTTTDKPAKAAATVAPAPVKPKLTVSLIAPTGGVTVRSGHVSVRGTVVPADANVQVVGKTARVSSGIFRANAALDMGENTIDVVATAEGADPVTTTVSVTRGRTSAQLAASAAAKRKRKAAAAAARKRRKEVAAARAAKKVSVPDEIGERLDVAEDDLRGRGLRYEEIGGGAFGIVVTSNWTVCDMRPGAGSQVSRHSRVKLVVDREC